MGYSCGSAGVVNFMAPGRGFFGGACPCKLIVYGENALFLWNLILFSQAWRGWFDDQGGVYHGCGFRDPWGRGSLLGLDRGGHKLKLLLFYLRSSALWGMILTS